MTTPQRSVACRARFVAKVRAAGPSVLLIDDVITTGAQTSAAARALRCSGAEFVQVLAVAVAISPPETARRLGSSTNRFRTIFR